MATRDRLFEQRLVTLRITPEELRQALQLPVTVRIVAAVLQPYNAQDTIQLTITSPQLPEVRNNEAIQSMALDEALVFFSGRYSAHPPSDEADPREA